MTENQPVSESSGATTPKKPVFAPKKPPVSISPATVEQQETSVNAEPSKPKPVFTPKKPTAASLPSPDENLPFAETEKSAPKPVFIPKKPISPAPETTASQEAPPAKPKPVFVPKKPASSAPSQPMQEDAPAAQEVPSADAGQPLTAQNEISAKPKPVFIPKKPTAPVQAAESIKEEIPETKNIDSGEEKPKPNPIFYPTMRPKNEDVLSRCCVRRCRIC